MSYCKRTGIKYCSEDVSKIENFDKAASSNMMYHFHHRLETDLGVSRTWLIKHNLYYKRPASELILLTREEHQSIHEVLPETRIKMSNNRRGKHHSIESRKKIADSNRKRKGMSYKSRFIICPLILYKMLNIDNIPQNAISKKLNVSQALISKRLKKYNIRKDETSENRTNARRKEKE